MTMKINGVAQTASFTPQTKPTNPKPKEPIIKFKNHSHKIDAYEYCAKVAATLKGIQQKLCKNILQ